jgi:UDP-2,3-diacylglucosamine pyrophosphatase LpxH
MDFDNYEDTNELVELTEENYKQYADQLQFETLAHECIVEDLARSYNMSTKDIFKLIYEIKKRGNNVVTLNTTANTEMDPSMPEKNEQVTLVRNFGHQTLVDEMTYNIVDNDDQIKVMLISDTRFGSKYEQPTLLNDLFVKAKKLGCKYVFLSGDVVEGIYTGQKSIYNSTLHKNGAEDQAEYVAQVFPRVEGITTLFVTGEHDLSFLKTKEKIDVGTLIDSKRDDMIYLGPKRRKITFNKDIPRSGEISIYLQHAQGNVPYTVSYKPQQKIASFRNEDKTEILVTSHFAACDSFERRGVRSFQVPTMVATTDEMRDASTPVYNTVGGWVVTLNRDAKGKLLNTSQLWIPYYDTIEDDYRYAKSLYLTDKKKVFVPRTIEKDHNDRIYSKIKNGEELTSALEKLKMSELELGGVLEELIARGYNVKIVENEGKTIISKGRRFSKKNVIKPDMSELTRIRETWISDTHLCNEAQQLHMIYEIYEETARRGIPVVRHFGDISDGDYTNRTDHRYELFRLGFRKQREYILNNWPQFDGITTIEIDGNHDLTHSKNGGAILGEDLGLLRDDFVWAGKERAVVHPKDINGKET